MQAFKIPFNKPFFTGKETRYIQQAVKEGKVSGNGLFTKKCHQYFQEKYGFKKCLLTSSCTDALEMAAILINIQPGDEVIMPAYTFVSTANAFALRGATIKFVDSKSNHPSMDEEALEQVITSKTKAIVVVHYAGTACDMDLIMQLANKHKLFVIEDAAQAIDNYYINQLGEKKALGSIGHLAAFSFHETKNIISGEGGMLAVNDKQFEKRAEIIWEKGTNRAAFFRGEVQKYQWVDIGSSFLPSEITAAVLYAQLEGLEKIQEKRTSLWASYFELLKPLKEKGLLRLPFIPAYSTNNAHIFYIECKSSKERNDLIDHLKKRGINAVFHYQSLSTSEYYSKINKPQHLLIAEHFSDCLLRLPLFYELTKMEVKAVTNAIKNYYKITANS